ncbi:MAG: hypothetical protein U1E97_06455 [Alphaproteobacteria bacterium]
MMVSFEIHTFRDGAWKIDSIFDDRDLALSEAKRMEEKNRYGAIRVIEETFNVTSNSVNTRTIFRSTKVDTENREATTKKIANDKEMKARKMVAPAERIRLQKAREKAQAEKKHGTYAGLILKLGVIVILGVATLISLRFLKS